MGRMKKKTKSLWAGMLLLSALTILSLSCKREVDDVILPGDSVVFKASADYVNGPETKTTYSGVEYGGKERIDWVSGDKIRILSDKARHPGGAAWSDYQVTGVTPGTGSNQPISYASIKNVGDNGLHWGSGTHKFYAVYPSPAANSNISINDNVANITLPKSQLQAAQMDYAYMFAAVQTAEKATVNLSFKPMFTAFQFQVRSDEEASMTITSFSLSTGENKAMTGSCRATITAATNSTASTAVYSNFTAYNASSGNNTITVDMGAGVTVTPSTYATITVFALPQDYSQLTASFTTSTGDTKSLKLQQADGTWVNFTACHKYNINGLGLPGGGWTYTVSDIDDIIRTGEEVLYDYSKDVTVTVRRSRTNGTTTENIPWKAYFTAASDPTAVVGASAVGQSWSETPLQDADGNDWLSLSAYSGDGNANNVKVSLAGNELPPSAIDLMVNAQAMTTAMNANNLGTIDVSRLKFNGTTFAYRGSNPANTANCYVINGYGTFYIPLVYGNGVQNGSAANAYVGTTGTDCLETFVNADGQPITSDFILQDANLTKSGQYEARIVWQDVAPGFQIIRDSDVAYVPAGSSELSSVAALNCAYLKFQVRQYQSAISGKGIKPGNAVIALYDKGEDKILWSWHIWFTNEQFSTFPLSWELSKWSWDDWQYHSYDGQDIHLSSLLGWTPPISYLSAQVNMRSQKVIITSEETNRIVCVFNVVMETYDSPGHVGLFYSATTYQEGRKDPLIGCGTEYGFRRVASKFYNVLIPNPNSPGYYKINVSTDGLQSSGETKEKVLGFHIRKPYGFVPERANNSPTGGGLHYKYYNLWSARTDVEVIPAPLKTIYDPSPAGFRVPGSLSYQSIPNYNSPGTLPSNLSYIPPSGEMPYGIEVELSTVVRLYFASGIPLSIEGITYFDGQTASWDTSAMTFYHTDYVSGGSSYGYEGCYARWHIDAGLTYLYRTSINMGTCTSVISPVQDD